MRLQELAGEYEKKRFQKLEARKRRLAARMEEEELEAEMDVIEFRCRYCIQSTAATDESLTPEAVKLVELHGDKLGPDDREFLSNEHCTVREAYRHMGSSESLRNFSRKLDKYGIRYTWTDAGHRRIFTASVVEYLVRCQDGKGP